jgi:hypothetical protein
MAVPRPKSRIGIVGYNPKKAWGAKPIGSYGPGNLPYDPNYNPAAMIPEGGTWGGEPLGPGYSGQPIPPGGGGTAPQDQPQGGGGRWVTPDYSGILGQYTSDARNRFAAGLQAAEAGRLSNARGLVNRLGIRDVQGMLGKLGQYGLTQGDLQGAADNPWSELKALETAGRQQWNQTVANKAARGGYRSGGTINARQQIDQDLARNEAMLTQDTLEALSQGQQNRANWEREQRDAMEQNIASQQAALAAAYQPYWVQD